MSAWGVFNDEGLLEHCDTAEEAVREAQGYRDRYYRDEDDGDPFAYAAEQCPEHEGETADGCEECAAEDEESDEDDDESER